MASGNAGGTNSNADYYDVLGVPDTATGDDITRAYRRLARQHHPDHNPDGGSKRFQEITDAYDVIGDAERRRRYDADRRGGTGGGVRIPVRPTGRPVIRLSPEEAAGGAIAVVTVTEERPCDRCGGSGSFIRRTGQIPVRHICPACRATGTVRAPRPVKVRVPAGVKDGTTLRINRKPPHRSFEALVQIA